MNAQYYFDIGISFIKNGKLKEALTCFEESTKLQPDFPNANFGVGVCLIKLGDIAKGNAIILKAARLGSLEAQSYIKSGNIVDNTKFSFNTTSSIEGGEGTIRAQPVCANPSNSENSETQTNPSNEDNFNALDWKKIGLKHLHRHELQKARDAFVKSVQLRADDDYALRELARIYTSLNQTREAIHAYESAYKVNPKDKQVLLELVPLYKQLGQSDNLINALEDYANTYPDLIEPCSDLAEIYYVTKSYDKSAEKFAQAISLCQDWDCDRISLLNKRLLQCEYQLNNFEFVYDYFDEYRYCSSPHSDPEYIDVLKIFLESCLRLKDHEQAQNIHDEIISIDPNAFKKQ